MALDPEDLQKIAELLGTKIAESEARILSATDAKLAPVMEQVGGTVEALKAVQERDLKADFTSWLDGEIKDLIGNGDDGEGSGSGGKSAKNTDPNPEIQALQAQLAAMQDAATKREEEAKARLQALETERQQALSAARQQKVMSDFTSTAQELGATRIELLRKALADRIVVPEDDAGPYGLKHVEVIGGQEFPKVVDFKTGLSAFLSTPDGEIFKPPTPIRGTGQSYKSTGTAHSGGEIGMGQLENMLGDMLAQATR